MRRSILVVDLFLSLLLALQFLVPGCALAQGGASARSPLGWASGLLTPLLIQWGGPGAGDGEFSFPRGLAVYDEGHLLVADTWNSRVQVFTVEGAFQYRWGSAGSAEDQFSFPSDAAIAADGRVFIADTRNHRIQVYTLDGAFLYGWGGQGAGESLHSAICHLNPM